MIGIPKPRPSVLRKRDVLRVREREAERVNRAIALRDDFRCRCCGRQGRYESTVAAKALHRHHVVYRSKQGVDTIENLVTLCAYCHALIHARQLWIVGNNANGRLQFEIHEIAVVDVFGTSVLPPHVHIVTARRKPN